MWQDRSKLIGYGVYSLVFRPPFLPPSDRFFPNLSSIIEEDPSRYVGIITTADRYQNEIKRSTGLLKQLSLSIPDFLNFTVFPMTASTDEKSLSLQNEDVRELVERFHAVRKKVEYEGTWKDKVLIQLIYPYAGKPLAAFCKKPQGAPDWRSFFQGMADIAVLLTALHDCGYVHGDLSPNNLLYDQMESEGKFTIVDWGMLCPAGQFLKETKGHMRVGCWSPEHFSLTTSRLKNVETDCRWLIYSKEMQMYIQRLLDFSFSIEPNRGRAAVREYFNPYTSQPDALPFQAMYDELKTLANIDPSAIGRYHDIRYLMDTIAKIVSCVFPHRTEAQQNRYNAFLALCLVQNLPDRTFYLENPNRLIRRLSLILRACENVEQETASPQNDGVEAEATLMDLLR